MILHIRETDHLKLLELPSHFPSNSPSLPSFSSSGGIGGLCRLWPGWQPEYHSQSAHTRTTWCRFHQEDVGTQQGATALLPNRHCWPQGWSTRSCQPHDNWKLRMSYCAIICVNPPRYRDLTVGAISHRHHGIVFPQMLRHPPDRTQSSNQQWTIMVRRSFLQTGCTRPDGPIRHHNRPEWSGFYYLTQPSWSNLSHRRLLEPLLGQHLYF